MFVSSLAILRMLITILKSGLPDPIERQHASVAFAMGSSAAHGKRLIVVR
jgi:hypothetical protein